MKPKRQPVIDAALRSMPMHLVVHRKQIYSALARARRFYMTEDASTKLGKIMGGAESLMLDNHQFAVPPFETMYIEFNCKLMYEAAGKVISNSSRPDAEDVWLGMLLDKGHIWVFSENSQNKYGIGPWMFEDGLGHASVPFPKKFKLSNAGAELARIIVMLGTGLHYLPDMETFNEIAARFSIHRALKLQDVYEDEDVYSDSSGDIRNFIAVLLVLNTPQRIKYMAQPPTHGLVKGKRITFKGHSVVNIELGKSKDITRFFNHHSGIKHRRHEVRGHIVHYNLDKNCTHDWPTVPEGMIDNIPRWRCRKCRGLRVWRKEHQRGDATLGWVDHTYKVTT